MYSTRHYQVAASRRRLAILLLVVLGLCGASVVEGQPAIISFEPDSGNFDCYETWTVDVMIDASVTDLRGFSLVLEFDPTVITPYSVAAGGLVTGAACPNFFRWLNELSFVDTIEVDGANLGCSVAGPGSIITIVFHGYVEGTSYLRCNGGLLRDGQNAPILFDCEEATVDYLCAVPSAGMSWSTMKTIYR